ncbi:MAG: GGDEF domain-containing protein [Syntrophales bacterium]|jgi:diguanylate cyclase (GGDEF)-like protein|nr:GGDEF domain-containing protein [Syntrophales bacterium]
MNILARLEKQDKIFKMAVGFALLAAIVILDFFTGQKLAISLFYLLPISFVTWFLGRWPGIVVVLAGVLVLFAAGIYSGHIYQNEIVAVLNILIRFSLFVFVLLLLSALKSAMEREKELASTDYLTGAANARRFFELLGLECHRLQRYGRPFTLVYLDLDNFKEVNDRFGHPEGDRALRTIVRYAREHLRKIDVIARLGGDELAFLLPELDQESARAVLVKLQNGLLEEMKLNHWPVTFSIGVVTCNRGVPKTATQLLQIADALMYSVKHNGKNGIAYLTYTGNAGGQLADDCI